MIILHFVLFVVHRLASRLIAKNSSIISVIRSLRATHIKFLHDNDNNNNIHRNESQKKYHHHHRHFVSSGTGKKNRHFIIRSQRQKGVVAEKE